MRVTYKLEGTIFAIQPLATCSRDLMDAEGGKNKPIPVPVMRRNDGIYPYFPGTGLRGKIRRAARDVIRSVASSRLGTDKPFGLDQHYLFTLGGIKGSDEQDRSTVAMDAEWRERNPLLSVFGAGDAGTLGFMAGHLSVGNAIAGTPCSPIVFSGARTDDLYRDKTQINFLSENDVEALIAKSKGNSLRASLARQKTQLEDQLKKSRNDPEKAAGLRAQITELEDRIVDVKQSTGSGDVSVGLTLSGWQAIPPDTSLDHLMLLTLANDVELGLLLKALDNLSKFPIVGAHYANGCGLIAAQWDVTRIDDNGQEVVGKISFGFDGPNVAAMAPFALQGDGLKRALAAFEAWTLSDKPDFSIPTALVE